MARPVTVTKERILSAAIDLVRSGGPSALTARGLCTRLDCGANAIFSAFGSIQGVRDAAREEARKLYRKRVGDGFALNPPFKGFGMAFIWFAMDEPHLFSMIMEAQTQPASYNDYIDTYVGFKEESLSAIADTFGLHGEDSETLYYQLILVALGLASTCTSGKSGLTIPQVSEILGKNVRAFLMVIHAGNDEREGFVPNAGGGPGGEVDSYVLTHALIGQNHLLQQLRAKPRYIQDEEWTELERMLRNSCDLTPDSLRQTHPDLTKGDIRAYILSHLQFPVSDQAVLLGISPASVTKARQRLKAKLDKREFTLTDSSSPSASEGPESWL
ncbi:MAG: TetR/AcrR family transcriptional regulator [Bacteroidales bacterium]|nr:TetR/AcrR family transcriptional regulator [Bacteroidales bacterium]